MISSANDNATEEKDVEENIKNMEKEYVALIKAIGDENLNLDKLRKEIRLKRQDYLEHKFKVQRRSIKLKRLQDYYESTSNAFNELKIVTNEVASLRAQLNLLSVGSQKTVNYDDELILREKYRQYHDYLSELQYRKQCAMSVLEKPLQSAIVEEIISNQLDDEIEFNTSMTESIVVDHDYLSEFQQIEELVQENDIRRSSLEQRAQLLKEERNKFKAIKFKKQAPPKLKDFSVTINYTANLTSADNDIQDIISLLNSKRQKLKAFKAKTKTLEEKHKETRIEVEEKYNQKSKMIKRFNKRIEAIGIIEDTIKDLRPKNQALKTQLAEILMEKARLERRIENIIRDQTLHSKKAQQLDVLRQKYNERRDEYENHQLSIKERYEKYNILLKYYQEEDEKLNSYEETVKALENEVKSLETNNLSAIRKVNIFKSDTGFVIANYAALHRNDSVPTIEIGLEKTFEIQ